MSLGRILPYLGGSTEQVDPPRTQPGHRRRFINHRLAATLARVRDAGLQEEKAVIEDGGGGRHRSTVSDVVRAFPDYIPDATGSLRFT